MASNAIKRLLSALRTHVEVTIMAAKEALSPDKLQNPDGLDKKLLEKLRAHLGRLKEADADVAARTLRYVVDGEDEEVLLTLGGLKDAGNVLILGTLSG